MEAEVLFILVLALIVLGPRRLPEIGRQIGKALAELRRAKWEFTRQIEDEIRRIEEEEAQTKAAKTLPAADGPILKAEPEVHALSAEAGTASGAAATADSANQELPTATRAENTILKPTAAPKGTIQMELIEQPPSEHSDSQVGEADSAVASAAANQP